MNAALKYTRKTKTVHSTCQKKKKREKSDWEQMHCPAKMLFWSQFPSVQIENNYNYLSQSRLPACSFAVTALSRRRHRFVWGPFWGLRTGPHPAPSVHQSHILWLPGSTGSQASSRPAQPSCGPGRSRAWLWGHNTHVRCQKYRWG